MTLSVVRHADKSLRKILRNVPLAFQRYPNEIDLKIQLKLIFYLVLSFFVLYFSKKINSKK